MARLGDVCFKITDGSHNPPQGVSASEYLMLSSKNIFDDVITLDDPRYLSKEDFELENKRTQIATGDILLTIVGTVGRAAVVPDLAHNICLQRSVAVLKPKSETVLPRYLMYQLQSMRAKLEKEAKGVAQKGIYLKQVENLPIRVLSMDEQTEIVSSLDVVSNLLSLRKQQLAKLDELVKSRFVELTEMAPTTPTRMGDIATYLNGYAFKPDQWEDKGLPIIRIQNLNNPDAAYNYYSGELAEKYLVLSGDVLVSWATHLEAYVWKGESAWLNQHIFKVVFDKMDVDKIYFVFATEEALRQAFKNAHGFKPTMEHIKKADFDNAVVKLPPLPVQREFSRFAQQVDKSKFAVQQSIEKLETLKKSLMQQYFG